MTTERAWVSSPPRRARRQRTSVAERLEALPFGRFHRNFLLMVTAGEFVETMMLLGNGVLLALVATTLHFSSAVATWAIPVSFFAGEFVGSVVSGQIADRFGRKAVFNYDLLVFALGMIGAGFMSSALLVGVFIFIAGLGVGGEFPVVDAYTTEMFPGKDRGRRMATVYTLAVLAAPLIAALAWAVSHPTAGYYSWRALFWFIGVCGFVVWVIRFRVPESPRWLEAQGRPEEAHEVVSGFSDAAAASAPVPPKTLATAADGASTGATPKPVTAPDSQPSTFARIFAPHVRGRTTMMLIFQFFQSGLFYGFTTLAPLFLLHKGISLVHTLLFSMIIYAGFFAGSLFSMYTIDKIERKWGIVATAILSGVFGTAFAEASSVTVTVIFGFLTTFTLWQFSNFLHTYQAEIFPTDVRTTAAGAVYSVSRISTALWVYVIGTVLAPDGILVSFGLIWLFIAVIAVDIGVFGPRSSRLAVEEIAT
jgi:MFS transporter, putative metabolite:H+ symporter